MKFISAVISAIGAGWSVPPAIFRLLPPKARKEADYVEAADLSRIPAGTPEEVSFQRTRVDGWKVTSEKATAWVVKTADNQVTAFAPQCTHLGCAYHWDQPTHNFVCPCHTSAFSIDGKVLGVPAPRRLDQYMLKIQGNKLSIGPLDTHA